MDTGHYNCRDYLVSPHFAPTTVTSGFNQRHSSSPAWNSTRKRWPMFRHESFDELEHRSRSPASLKPKFPLLKLPLELRRQILGYLLPYTRELNVTTPLSRNIGGAVQKRSGCASAPPKPASPNVKGSFPSNIAWQRGNVSVLQVCRQLHDEAADIMYGENTFLLLVTYADVTFRFRWLLPSGLTPSRSYDFLSLTPLRYLVRVKRVVVDVEHVDSYTSMIKFNVGGAGLVHGLRAQVQRLVLALTPEADEGDGRTGTLDCESVMAGRVPALSRQPLTRIRINVLNRNAVYTTIKGNSSPDQISGEIEEILDPFRQLSGVHEVAVTGRITVKLAQSLEKSMTNSN